MNQNNPTNSSVIQMLRDIEKFGIEVPKEFFKEIDGHKKAIDDIWDSHQYPMDSLTFTKLSRETGVFLNLPIVSKTYGTKAVSLLLIIVQNVGSNLLFALSRQDAMELLDCSKNTAKGTLNALVEYGVIAVFQKAKGRGNPTIYMLNPMIADVGKPSSKQDRDAFWELAGDIAFLKYLKLCDKQTAADVVRTEDKTQYVVIKPKPEEKTEESEEVKKVTETKKESIPGLTEQQKQGIDSIFSSNM